MTIANDRLRAFIERIERLEEEKKTIADDVKEIYGEARGQGYDVKILRKVIALRRLDNAERQEQEAILDLYLTALGMKAQGDLPFDTPAGEDPAAGRTPPSDAETVMTMSVPDGKGGTITSVPFTSADLKKATAQIRALPAGALAKEGTKKKRGRPRKTPVEA